eukprot:SAG31_NODE_10395_length_1143_cov_2.895594_1_plen_167_part_00
MLLNRRSPTGTAVASYQRGMPRRALYNTKFSYYLGTGIGTGSKFRSKSRQPPPPVAPASSSTTSTCTCTWPAVARGLDRQPSERRSDMDGGAVATGQRVPADAIAAPFRDALRAAVAKLAAQGTPVPKLVGFLANADPAARKYAEWCARFLSVLRFFVETVSRSVF